MPVRLSSWVLLTSTWLGGASLHCSSQSPPPDGGAPPPGAALSLTLPDAWAAESADGDGSLKAGPPGRPVLRIDRVTGVALPSLDRWIADYRRAMPRFRVEALRRVETDGFAAVVLSLDPDEPAASQGTAFLAAALTAHGIALCASQPAALASEVEEGLRVCQGLRDASQGRPP